MNNENFINLVKTNTCFKGKGILYWSDIDELEVFFQEHLVWWRQHLKKKSLKFLIYQDYKNLLWAILSSNYCLNLPSFENKFVNVLNKHSSKKTKVFRGN